MYSEAQGRIRGAKKGGWAFWIPPSAEDFKGLIYKFIWKGTQGEAHMAFFKKALFDPFNRAYTEINAARQALSNGYRNLLKSFPSVKSILSKKISDTKGLKGKGGFGNYTYDHAVRVYLWNKLGMEIPGISMRDQTMLAELVENDAELKAFADELSSITKLEQGYLEPSEYWTIENIDSDLTRLTGEVGRAQYLAEWKQNIEEIFGTWENGRLVGPNMNKIEAIYGANFREALEDMIWAMEYGTSRNQGRNRIVNAFNNWANQSVGAIMFFNMRSALLQTISSINFINWSDNNPLKAAVALANFPQFIKDFAFIFNSDMLKQRRAGQQRGVNEAELARAAAGAKNGLKLY